MLAGFYVRLSECMDVAANRRVHALTRKMVAEPLLGVTDVIPGYGSLYLEFDTSLTSETSIKSALAASSANQDSTQGPKQIDIPVQYDGEDLEEVAARVNLSVEAVVERHSSRCYHVYALGFTPGLPFMGEVEEKLRLPRRGNPRARVPAHTVAIANAQTNIYPIASPGGWNLLGRALLAVYDPNREKPFYIEPGDQVRFVPSQGEPPPEPEPLVLLTAEPRKPLLKVLAPGLQDLVVDSGRMMVGRYGLCRSGALDARSARIANALLRNPPGVPLIEMSFKGPTLEVLSGTVLAFAGWGVAPKLEGKLLDPFRSFAVRTGEVLTFEPIRKGARGYLSAVGGFESDTFMGSASVDIRGKIGRPLVIGDTLGAASDRQVRPGFGFRAYRSHNSLHVRLLPGPQATHEATLALTSQAFTVDRADRMGVQLAGGAVPGGEVLSEGTPLGAIQVTPAGKPIILLHDRGSVGGYSKPALVHPSDLPKLAQLRPGELLRFKLHERL
jgi:KipI family sensor histidine kinase inhibitor